MADLHHPVPTDATANRQPVHAREEAQAKQVFDQSALLRERLHRQTAVTDESAEGIGSFLEGAVAGDFSDNDSWSKTGGQIVGGLIPIYGQLADARDTAAAIRDVSEGKAGGGIALAAAIIGWVPVVGDSAKAALRAGRKVLRESAAEVAERAVRENAATLSRIAEPQVRAMAEQAVRSEALVKYEARELGVAKQMDELATQGHGPQRHGSQITERQLDDRAMYSIDPVTGTKFDAYLKNADGTPKLHRPTKHATKVMSDEAYVESESFIRSSRAYRDALNKAEVEGLDGFVIKDDVSLESIFGADYKNHVFGKTRLGSETHPTGSIGTDLTDGTMRAVFRKNAGGGWDLLSMFPEPKK